MENFKNIPDFGFGAIFSTKHDEIEDKSPDPVCQEEIPPAHNNERVKREADHRKRSNAFDTRDHLRRLLGWKA